MDERKVQVGDGQRRGWGVMESKRQIPSSAPSPLPHSPLCSTLGPFPLSRRVLDCTPIRPLIQSAVTSKAELYGLCVRTTGGEWRFRNFVKCIETHSLSTWRNYAPKEKERDCLNEHVGTHLNLCSPT